MRRCVSCRFWQPQSRLISTCSSFSAPDLFWGIFVDRYAVVNMRDFNVVATGETLQAAIRLYQQKLSMDRTQSDSQAAVETITADFVVQRIGSEVRSGGTVYFLTVQGKPDLMLMGNSELSEELVLTQVGDKVSVKFKKGPSLVAPMTSLDNLAIGK